VNVETDITPPDVEPDDDGDERSSRLSLSLLDVDDVHYDTAVQFFGHLEPDRFAEALLNMALALASMRGPDFQWAVMQRFAAYDGLGR
jgi:hypothetical protein